MLLKFEKFISLGGFNTKYKVCSDYDLLLRLYKGKARTKKLYLDICTYEIGDVNWKNKFIFYLEHLKIVINLGKLKHIIYWFLKTIIYFLKRCIYLLRQ